MIGQVLIINFKGDKAYLSDDKVLTLRQLGLPDIAQRFKSHAAWTIKVLNYFPEEQKVFAEILTYTTSKLDFPFLQISGQMDINSIEIITFRSIYTNGLLATLAGTSTPQTIKHSMEKVPERKERPQIFTEPAPRFKQEPQTQTIKETYFLPFKKVSFKLRGVSFIKWVAQLKKTIEFTVSNEEIREEFDAVKNYFGNVLRVKKIQFDIEIQLMDGMITSIEATSPQIALIDQNMIESVKFEVVKSISERKFEGEIDKSLFTMTEIFDSLTDEHVKASVFYDNENQFIQDLLQITDTKHYKHLNFLSSKHAHNVMKLRFVIKPFSFVFLIEGERNYHVVWETLNTEEATYVWHVVKERSQLELTLKKIDNIINTIKAHGKTNYIKEAEDIFKRIYHDYSDMNEGFIKWKNDFESILT